MHASVSQQNCDVFFLGAGRPAFGDKPAALKEIGVHSRALDWQLHSLSALPQAKIHFLGGYHIEEVIAAYPQLHYIVVPRWQENSVLHTLFQAPWRLATTIVSYADTVFRPEIMAKVYEQTADVVWVYDSQWRDRFEQRKISDINNAEVIAINNQQMEFTGLIKFSPQVSEYISTLHEEDIGRNLIDLLHYLSAKNFSIATIDARGNWSEFNSPLDIAHFVLGTKAETLARLAPRVKKSKIGQQVCFTVANWQQESAAIVETVMHTFPRTRIIVRSSAKTEDNWLASNAGGYTSVLDVDSTSALGINHAITQVIQSYSNQTVYDQILIQEFLSNVQCAGVVFTRGLETGAPYYRINFDNQSFSTESVTAGNSNQLRTVLLSRANERAIQCVAPELMPIISAIKELEILLDYDRLDIEFAVDKTGNVHIFQVRPITVDHSEYDLNDAQIFSAQENGAAHFNAIQTPTPFVLGKRTILGVMPDWNPAEIIGKRPRPLAFSLYRFLITDDIWASARAQFGYRDIRPHPLLVALCGQPYVDIRASLNSFLPANISETLGEKLVNAYLAILTEQPQLHDKLEFSVAFTVWTPTFKTDAIKRLMPLGISVDQIDELSQELKKITCHAFKRLERDIASLALLEKRRQLIQNSDMGALNKAILLLEDCKNFGTLAFAHAARAGFVAMSFLNSLVSATILTVDEKQKFLNSIKTIAGEFEDDSYKVLEDKLTSAEFLAQYGHLRPGTYDIMMDAYWEDPERYLLQKKQKTVRSDRHPFEFREHVQQAISMVLKELDPDLKFVDFIEYLKSAIKAREWVKFKFTRNLSVALDHIILWGQENGFSRELLSYLQWEDLKQRNEGILDDAAIDALIKHRKKSVQLTQMIELPQLILTAQDFYCFERMSAEPNFITRKSVSAPVVKEFDDLSQLQGAIVLISQADPGYDWLFSHGIAGLITQYGGANSHMAIRAAEMSLPAAIGVGEKLYEELSKAHAIHLDCALQFVRGVS